MISFGQANKKLQNIKIDSNKVYGIINTKLTKLENCSTPNLKIEN